ncbi:Starch-binding associating with outer membrane [Parapedobacter luteus]|uniref:Starch-binding associating with outer membrane n=1 Tax=Parapedobacter luteus TaxID=623280 RepID=A0A1T5EM95_9SPHI|nr:SusD/RagB family nutrient-binding outer membrane lipoprotein [Parapedobacter luteus]SKB84985.1 Starch-binding associating with outer membrane [Parapedobacter luteus]
MNMLNRNTITGSLITVLLATSCTRDFDEVNTDPNKIEKVTPGSMLTPTIYGMSTYFTVRSYDFTWQLMQVGLPHPSSGNAAHWYYLQENSGNGTWNTCYRLLRNLREMDEAADEYDQPIFKAVAATLRAYIVGILTDSFGDVPFSEAMQAEEGINRPRFDTQEEIYHSLIEQLEEANRIYAAGGDMVGNDLLYGEEATAGDQERNWRRFNNSLLMRMILRMSKRTEQNSYQRLQAMIDNPDEYPVFTSNAEAALVKISGLTPYDYAWGRRQDYVNFEAMAEFFVDMLNELADPRRPLFMTRARRLENGEYVDLGYRGIPSAHSGDASQFNYDPSTPNGDLMVYTTLGTEIIEVMMSYAEVEFIKAEVAFFRGDMAAAEAAYRRGVEAAITQWKGGVMPDDYFENEAARFDGTFERIMNQKYLALFFNDYQQWFEYRRTGYPELPKTPHMLHQGQMPTRFMYHTDVRRFNRENYQEAVQRMGADDFHTKVWWER